MKVIKRIFGLALVLALAVSLFGCTASNNSRGNSGGGGFTMTSFPPVSTYTPKPQETQPSGNDNREPVTQTEQPNVGPAVEPTVAPSQAAYEITYQKTYIYTNSINDTCLYAMIEIQNTGGVDLRLADAKFELEDRNGKLLATCNSFTTELVPQIIAPGEKGYIYYSGSGVKGDVSESTDYVFVPNLDIRVSKKSLIRFELSDIELTKSDSAWNDFELIGRATNTTNEEHSLAEVFVIFFNKVGEPVTIESTYLDTVAPGGRTSFSVSNWFRYVDFTYEDIGNYVVIAYPYQFQFDW